MTDNWEKLESEITSCRICPRLVEWREKVAREKRRAYLKENYWGKPVPGFGDKHARVLIIGLAPGAHGSNRTGRMFTGDASGDFLYPALHKAGFSSEFASTSLDDGLQLKGIFITAVCRCVPPRNKPTRDEQKNCRKYLLKEISLLCELKGIVALGEIAFKNAYDVLSVLNSICIKKRPKFGHGRLVKIPNCLPWLLASYHPSRQNTQTGRLTVEMFADIWSQVQHLLN